ncbi:MAG: hypothetical protein HY590_01240 [Candidatus Omnitrophica bacterium]|nr:hypothetical protein [Candidatus Omnitrophota bacterium]
MRKFFFLIFFLSATFVFANEVSDTFFLANQKYSEGNYEEAITFYEKLVESGIPSGPLYYNLGNSYMKLGRLGKSILNYERAKRLMGLDEDLLANLSYVESQLEQAQPKEEHRFYEIAFFWVRNQFTAEGWIIFLAVVFNLLFVVLTLATFVKKIQKPLISFAWLLAIVTAFSFLFGFSKMSATEKEKEGVIVETTADVRYSPSTTGAVAFQLKEGIRAQILRKEGDFCYIRLTRDKTGWVAAAMIEEI